MVVRKAKERVKIVVQKSFRKFGINIEGYVPLAVPEIRRMRLMQFFQIDVVLDVGANEGQFGKSLRKHNFQGFLHSFEPLKDAFGKLQLAASDDSKWKTYNHALGADNSHTVIHVAGNSQSSSLLPMLSTHIHAAPDSAYVATQPVEVKTLDSIFHQIAQGSPHVYLKIDTQGFEKEVLAGAAESLQKIHTIQLEMSLFPLYQNEKLFGEMYSFLISQGYRLCGVEPGFCAPETGELLQLDGIFHRYES